MARRDRALLAVIAALALIATGKPVVSGWVPIARWGECAKMAEPGVIFELRNAEGLSLFVPCTPALPTLPFDWKSAPLEFRAVPEPPPRRSTPIPPPKG